MSGPYTTGTQVILRSVAIYDADGTVVGEVNAPFGREDEAIARARLWAAAEGLLAALKAIVSHWGDEGLRMREAGNLMVEEAEAAIALAKSGTPA